MKNKISVLTGKAGSGKTELIKKILSESKVQNITVFDSLGSYSKIENQDERNINIFNFPFNKNYSDFPTNEFNETFLSAINKGSKIIIDEAYFFLTRNVEQVKELLKNFQESTSQLLLIFQDPVQIKLTPIKEFEYKEVSPNNINF